MSSPTSMMELPFSEADLPTNARKQYSAIHKFTKIAAEYAVNHNDKIRKLVLVSPSGVMKYATPALNSYISAALYPNNDTALTAFQTMSCMDDIDEKTVSEFVERMQLPNAKMAFMSTLLGLSNAKVITEKLNMITVPTMIVWGENDPVIPIEYAQSFVSGINSS